MKLRYLLLPLFMLGASGCVIHVGGDGHLGDGSSWEQRQEHNRDLIAQLQLGTSKSDVIAKLGQPDNSEAFSAAGASYEVLYYRTRHRHSDGETTRDETTPLVFRDGKLTGWGDAAYARATQAHGG